MTKAANLFGGYRRKGRRALWRALLVIAERHASAGGTPDRVAVSGM